MGSCCPRATGPAGSGAAPSTPAWLRTPLWTSAGGTTSGACSTSWSSSRRARCPGRRRVPPQQQQQQQQQRRGNTPRAYAVLSFIFFPFPPSQECALNKTGKDRGAVQRKKEECQENPSLLSSSELPSQAHQHCSFSLLMPLPLSRTQMRLCTPARRAPREPGSTPSSRAPISGRSRCSQGQAGG